MEQDELERISELIIGLSRSELLSLYKRINNKAEFVDYLGESLGAAVSKAADTDSFKQSIAPVVALGVLKTARQEPIEMGKAIAPALGPAIRGMITLALESMSQRVDAHIKTNFSIQGVKWRIESSRTGVPLVDIVMRETLDFRVEHIMLIHQETGTLLQEVSQPDIKTKDPAVVSSMLSAVSDFVVDAFGASNSNDEPQSYKVGDLTAYVESLGDLAIAVVVRGALSSSYKQVLRERLETICVVYGEKAHDFNGDVEAFDGAESMLRDCLVSVAKTTDSDSIPSTKRSFSPLLFAVCVLFLVTVFELGYQIWQSQIEKTRFEDFVDALSSIPGTALLNASRGDPGKVRMLVDPYAEDPRNIASQFGYSELEFDWRLNPYSSLHTEFVDKRIEKLLNLPEAISYSFNDGVLLFTGMASDQWIRDIQLLAAMIEGVNEIDLSNVVNSTEGDIERLIDEIESTPIYFIYGEAEFDKEGVEALEFIRKRLIELEESARHSAKLFDVLINIDPREISVNEYSDTVRSLQRVDSVESYLGRAISMGQIAIVDKNVDIKRPYGLLEVKFKE